MNLHRSEHHTGWAYLRAFDFEIRTEQNLSIVPTVIDGRQVRFYPPFRSAPTGFSRIPFVDHAHVPFLHGEAGTTHFPEAAINKLVEAGGTTSAQEPFGCAMDSLRVDAFEQTELDGWIEDVIARLIQHIRWYTYQFWIGRGPMQWNGGDNFPIDEDGVPAKLSYVVGPMSAFVTPHTKTIALNEDLWQKSIVATAANEPVPLWFIHLFNAMYDGFVRCDYRQAVLNASSACDYRKESVAEQLWREKHPGERYNRSDVLYDWDLPTHIDVDFKDQFGHSYRSERARDHSNIMDLYEARNNVAHGAPCMYGESQKRVNSEDICRFIFSAENCVEWLSNLSSPNQGLEDIEQAFLGSEE